MDTIPTMFSYNALVKTATGRLELHYNNNSLELTAEGSMLIVVGTQYIYRMRPSGLAVLEKEAAEEAPEVTIEEAPEDAAEVTIEVEPEVEPEDAAEVTIEVEPEVEPEVTIEVEPEVTIEVEPEVIANGIKTYFLQATVTSQGLELNTPDFVVFGNAIVSTTPLTKGTKIAVKTVKHTPGLLNVPGRNTLSFAPLGMQCPGNVGKMMMTNGGHRYNPLWSLTGPLENNFLFYVLTKDTHGTSKCTT